MGEGEEEEEEEEGEEKMEEREEVKVLTIPSPREENIFWFSSVQENQQNSIRERKKKEKN